MMQAGDIVSRLLLDMSDFRKAMKSAPGIAKRDLQKVNKQMATTMRQMDRSVKKFVDKSEAHGKKFEKGWWKRFGAVALGFTIAYRAMNAFERGLQKLSETVLEAIRESGELASIQAKLALWTTMHSKGVIAYGDAFRYARGTMHELMKASVTSLSAIGELTTGLDEMGQTLGMVRTETVKSAVDLIDFTVMVAQTTGSVTRQVRQEIQSLLQGQIRTTDIVIRTMRKMGVLTDENIAKLKAQIDVQETFDKVLVAISEHMEEFREQVLKTDVNKAFAYWEKSIRVVMVESIMLASVLEDVGNIFAEEFVRRAKAYREAMTKMDIARSIVLMQGLRNILALGLDAFEGIVRVAGILATAMTNLYDEISYVVKGIGLLLGIGVVTAAFKMFGKTVIWLYSTPLKLLRAAFTSLYLKIAAIPVAIILTIVALETLGDMFPEIEKKVKGAGKTVGDFFQRMLGPAIVKDFKEDVATVTRLLEKLFKASKKTAKETKDFWAEPFGEFRTKFLDNLMKKFEVFLPLIEKFKKAYEDAITPEIDIKALMKKYNEFMESAGLLTGIQTEKQEDLTDKLKKYTKEVEKLNTEYRISYTLRAMLDRFEVKPEDVDQKRKELEIEQETLALLYLRDPELTKLALRHKELSLALLKEQERIKIIVALDKERAAALKKALKAQEDQALLVYDPGPTEKYFEDLDKFKKKLRDLKVDAYTIMRDMYDDLIEAGQDYTLKAEETSRKLLAVQKQIMLERLSAYMDAKEAENLIDEWLANEQKKRDEIRRKEFVAGLKDMVDNYAEFFKYMAEENKKYFRLYKAAAIASAMIDTYEAAQAAAKWGMKYGGAIAPILSAAAATAAILAGLARIQTIRNQKYAVGGWLDEHPGGGPIAEGSGTRDDVFLGATPGVRHWAMRDEYVFVMNKQASKKQGATLEAMNQGYAGGGWIDKGYGGFGGFDFGNILDVLVGGTDADDELDSLAETTKTLREEFEDLVDELVDLVGELSTSFSEAATIFRDTLEAAVSDGVMFGEFFEMGDIDISIEPLIVDMDKLRQEAEALAQELSWTDAELENYITTQAAQRQEVYNQIAANQSAAATEAALADQTAALAAASQAALEETFYTLIQGSEAFARLSEDVQAAIEAMVLSGDADIDAILSYWSDLTEAFDDIDYAIESWMGGFTKLEEKIRSIEQQFDEWAAQLEYMGASLAELIALREKEAEVIAYITEEMQEEVWDNITDQLRDLLGTFSSFQKEVNSINDQFDAMIESLEDVGASSATLTEIEEARAEAIRKLISEEQEALLEDLEEQLAELRLDTDELAMWDLMQDFLSTMEDIYEQYAVTGDDYSETVKLVIGAYEELLEAAILESEAAQDLADAVDGWTSVAEAIEDVLWEMATTISNPADILERMSIVWDEILAIEEGVKDASELTPEELTELVDLYNDYLDMAQEAYQRPSAEYQAIYEQLISGGEGTILGLEALQDYAEDQADEYQTQLDQLVELELATYDLDLIAAQIMSGVPMYLKLGADNFQVRINDSTPVDVGGSILTDAASDWGSIASSTTALETLTDILSGVVSDGNAILEKIVANTATIADNTRLHWVQGGVDVREITSGSSAPYARYGGVFVGPESGYPVMLHGIERVTPLGGAGGGAQFEMNLIINESKTPRETGVAVRKEMESFMRSNIGRTLVQETSRGR